MKIQIKRSNRKTVSIQVRDGQVIVSAPHHTSEEFIQNFVNDKQSWIQKHLDRYEVPGFKIGNSLRVFGHIYDTSIVIGRRFSLKIIGDEIIITRSQSMSDEVLEGKVDTFFKEMLHDYLSDSVKRYATLLKLNVPEFKVRKFKRIHGRCMRRGDLAFNTYLYHDNYEFIDYVVLHECVHLIEFNHSKAFYDIIEKYMPEYKRVLKEKKNRTNPV